MPNPFESIPTKEHYDHYSIERKIGKGGFGVVYLVRSELDQKEYALKVVRVVESNERDIKNLEKEISLLATNASPYVTHLYDYGFDEDEYVWMILELCKGGSIGDIIRPGVDEVRPLYENQVISFLYFGLQALASLHEVGIIHRDIKAENFMLKANGEIRLADLGLGRVLEGDQQGYMVTGVLAGSPYWLSPEYIAEQKITTGLDMWSLGVTVIELLEGCPPLHEYLPMVAMFNIADPNRGDAVWFSPQTEVSEALKALVGRMLCRDVEGRISAKEALESELFVGLDEATAKATMLTIQFSGESREPMTVGEPDMVTGEYEMEEDADEEGQRSLEEEGKRASLVRKKERPNPTEILLKQEVPKIEKIEELYKYLLDPKNGLTVKNRRFRGKNYKMCFVGTDAVSIIKDILNLPNRESAVAMGAVLMQRGYFHHVVWEKPFLDAKLFYRFQVHSLKSRVKLGNKARKVLQRLEDGDTLIAFMAGIRREKSGVQVKDRTYLLRPFKKCFIGKEMVGWLCDPAQHELLLGEVYNPQDTEARLTRKDAVEIGNGLIARGIFHHVVDGEPFKDAKLFYRFYEDEGKSASSQMKKRTSDLVGLA